MVVSVSRKAAPVGWPRNRTSPPVGVSSRLRQRMKVDLPDPEGPISATTSPRIKVRSMPLSTSNGP
jgi:hypothetical protein